MGYERPLPKRIRHNLAESHEFLDGGKTALFKIREGIKWSDRQSTAVSGKRARRCLKREHLLELGT